jgi:reactive intermediate/imine deaminase
MKKQKIHSPSAPQAIGPYSQAIWAGNTVYLSGQIGFDPKSMLLVSEDAAMQTSQVFSNMQEVCRAAGGDVDDIVKLTIYLTDLAYFPVVNEVMAKYFSEPYPARTTIQVSALPKAAKIEIDAIMIVE